MPLPSPRTLLSLGAFVSLFAATALPASAAGETGTGPYPGLESYDMRNPRLPAGPEGSANFPGGDPRTGLTVRNDPAASNANGGTQNRTTLTTPGRRSDLAPPRPSEFQKFVEASTGRLLQPFGTRFFNDAADSFSPLDNVPVSGDYLVGPGDQLMIRAWGSIDVDYRATVDRSGQISLPKVGTFTVAGVRASNLESHLRGQIGRLYTNFNLNVTLGQLRGVKVFVVGPARVPGVYTLSSQSSLLSAVVAAGGPSPSGSMRKVLLRRDGRVVSELDIYDFLVQGDKSRDVQLQAGDVVVFQPAGPRVAVVGAIDSPAIYELKSAKEPTADVLRYAGDAPVLANPHRVQVERIDTSKPGAARFVQQFKLDAAGLQTPLQDGDVLTLTPISPGFANAVTLKGPVAQPLRHAFTPGMRIRDLIPDREALISPEFYRRKNRLVQVDEEEELRRERERDREIELAVARALGRSETAGSPDVVTTDPRLQADVGRPERRSAAAQRAGAGSGALLGAQGTLDREPSARDTGRYRETDRARDGYDDPYRRQGPRSDRDRNRGNQPLFDELNWDYAVIERLNPADLTTQVIPFNLGKAVLQGDEANNLELAPGDVVTIYSQKDVRVPVSRQTRLVAVLGEVSAPGTYQLRPGETLPELLARAGGVTPQAYVYGIEFSREETRQRQRENLEQAIARLESLSAVQAARDAANKTTENLANNQMAISSAATQAQIGRLSRLEPNGRIALELTPADTVDKLPAVPLEHQDQIIVPTKPAFITVAGAVVNNNAFLWKPGKTVGDYIASAGVDEAAELSNMFVLRADGTVTHASDSRGFFGGSRLESVALNPGDAIVVPNKLDYETWGRALVRNLKDWSQIFSQFGLGAAAIVTLRNSD